MKQILFIHSAEKQILGQGSGQIVSYLMESLGADYQIHFPLMPDPEMPRFQLWKETIENEVSTLGDDIILVGHSLGGSVILKYLTERSIKTQSIIGVFLLAPPFWGRDEAWQNDEFKLPEDFMGRFLAVPKIFIYHSRDDQWVPFSHLFDYAEALPNATLRKFGVRGHNFIGGIPELVADIRNL